MPINPHKCLYCTQHIVVMWHISAPSIRTVAAFNINDVINHATAGV